MSDFFVYSKNTTSHNLRSGSNKTFIYRAHLVHIDKACTTGVQIHGTLRVNRVDMQKLFAILRRVILARIMYSILLIIIVYIV